MEVAADLDVSCPLYDSRVYADQPTTVMSNISKCKYLLRDRGHVQDSFSPTAISNITVTRASGVFSINQCTRFRNGGVEGDCDTSKFQIRDVTISGIHGIVTKSTIATLKCSSAAPCKRMKFENLDVSINDTLVRPTRYSCHAVQEPTCAEFAT